MPVSVVGGQSWVETEKLECDLVMRGGITSGIVYPRAIAKLAETYNFRCDRRHLGWRHRRDRDGCAAHVARSNGGRSLPDRSHESAGKAWRARRTCKTDAGAAVPTTAWHKPSFQPADVGARAGGQGGQRSRGSSTTLCLQIIGRYSHCSVPPSLSSRCSAVANDHGLGGCLVAVLFVLGLVSRLMPSMLLMAAAGGLPRRPAASCRKHGYGHRARARATCNLTRRAFLPLTDWLHEHSSKARRNRPTR